MRFLLAGDDCWFAGWVGGREDCQTDTQTLGLRGAVVYKKDALLIMALQRSGYIHRWFPGVYICHDRIQ
jgi:hypothetical protein